MYRAFIYGLVIWFAVPPGAAQAWSECGHCIVALLAFDLLSAEEKAKVVALLEKHPRFAADFNPPASLPNDEEKLRWQIGRAGYWPDVIRKTELDRPTWHYEIGSALVIGDATKLLVPVRPGPLPDDATLKTQKLYISQALALCRRTLADKEASAADRAVAFCWTTHLVGDAHQPCHAGSLFMEGVFQAEDGDRGANRIRTKQVDNMHMLWDQLLGNEFDLNGVRKRMFEMRSDEELVAWGKQAIAIDGGLDPQTWLAESRAASKANVYAPEVLESLQLVARGVAKEPQPVDLSDAYLKNAGRIAQERVIAAGYRLAEVWRKAL